jgi:hypothetical protein
MHKFNRKLLGKLNIVFTLVLVALIAGGLGGASYVLASATSEFTQTINLGTYSVDIVDGSYASVGSPSVAMGAKTVSLSCQTATGTFGTDTERIYVQNLDAADDGWSVSLAAAATTTLWTSGGSGNKFDFNDAGGSGCTDSDGDTYGGQMTVNPSVGTLTVGQCSGCTTTGVSKGTSASFVADSVDSITILTGAAGSDDIGDWKLTGVSISQKIPASQPAASDYSVDLTLSIVAS